MKKENKKKIKTNLQNLRRNNETEKSTRSFNA